jgi:hypothetical protein
METAEAVAAGAPCRLWQELQHESGDVEMGLTLNFTSKRGKLCLSPFCFSFVFLTFQNSEASVPQHNFTENVSSTNM